MKEYKVKILDTAFADIEDIADFIVSVSTPEHALEYTKRLGAEIMSLSYLADVIPESPWLTVRRYHPHAKQMKTHNKRLTIIFHIENDLVIVDKIMATSRISH